jgi:hypothetical protein
MVSTDDSWLSCQMKCTPGINEVVHMVVAPPDVLLHYIHLVRGHSHNNNNGRHPSAQEFMAGQ